MPPDAPFLAGYGPALIEGLGTTLMIALTSLFCATVFGILGATAKLSPLPWARGLAAAYTTLIRGVPDLILMLALFYGGQVLINDLWASLSSERAPSINQTLAGVTTLGFIYGAYLTETFRGAILAVPRGQIEAAYACGMSDGQMRWRILIPQAVRHAIPGFGNTWLILVKASALVSVIGLDDLVHRANGAANATRQPFTFYLATGAIFLAVTTISLGLLYLIERRFSLGVRKASL